MTTLGDFCDPDQSITRTHKTVTDGRSNEGNFDSTLGWHSKGPVGKQRAAQALDRIEPIQTHEIPIGGIGMFQVEGHETRVIDDGIPHPGNAPESEERFHRQSLHDLEDHNFFRKRTRTDDHG